MRIIHLLAATITAATLAFLPACPASTVKEPQTGTKLPLYCGDDLAKGAVPAPDLHQPYDISWDKSSGRVYTLMAGRKASFVRCYSLAGTPVFFRSLPSRVLFDSRLFRQVGAICFLAGQYEPSRSRFLFSVDKSGALRQTSIDDVRDFDDETNHAVAGRRRQALIDSELILPVLDSDVLDLRTNITGSLADNDVRLRSFPVLVGSLSRLPVAFGPGDKVAAIGGKEPFVTWLAGRRRHRLDLARSILSRSKPKAAALTAYSVSASPQRCIFGVKLDGGEFVTVVVRLSGSHAQISSIKPGVFAPDVPEAQEAGRPRGISRAGAGDSSGTPSGVRSVGSLPGVFDPGLIFVALPGPGTHYMKDDASLSSRNRKALLGGKTALDRLF